MELLSIEDYINNLSEIENSVIGKSFFGFDFDSYPTNRPVGYYLKSNSNYCIIMAGCEINLKLYRGENKDYKDFSPIIKRNLQIGSLEHCFEWIKTEEFAEVLGISSRAVRKAIQNKKLYQTK